MLGRVLILLALILLPPQAGAEEIEVDLELVLLVDRSRSMSPHELAIQREGYRAALQSPEVLAAIRGGMLGRIAVMYMEWSGSASQRVVADWAVIEDETSAAAFAARIVDRGRLDSVGTSISGALWVAANRLRGNGYRGLRQVIDVSGDGPNNAGGPVTAARDAVLADGIIINGLPLMTREGMGSQWHLDDLDVYYRNCVIGGPGAFVIPVLDWDDFAEAVRRKLVLELVGLPPERLIRAQLRAPDPGYDCLIGEKIWERNRPQWNMP